MNCFAFNGDGLRCMQLAGHEGVHVHAIEWDDDACWTPETPGPTIPINGGPSIADVNLAVQAAAESIELSSCVVCEHSKPSHGQDGCVTLNSEGDPCGCGEFV